MKNPKYCEVNRLLNKYNTFHNRITYRETWGKSKIKLTPQRFEKGFKKVIFKLNFKRKKFLSEKKGSEEVLWVKIIIYGKV